MVIRDVKLETVCGVTSTIPDNPYDEVAFAGKSNVGKSSLINALMNRKSLARTSSQPGKTQTINFYNINDAVYLVDLPGYGYASAREEIKAQWGRMIENYLHQSKRLAAVFLLVDIRHVPSENDRMMYEWMLQQGFAPMIIATKADKLKRSQIAGQLAAIREGLGAGADTTVIPFSAETRQGREEIWTMIESLANLPDSAGAGQKAGEGDRAEGELEEGSREGCSAEEQSEAGGERKPRWKKTGRPVAKKTKKREQLKKAKKSGSRKK